MIRPKPPTLGSQQAADELNARLGMNIKGDAADPLANKINSVIPNRVTRDERGVQMVSPNDRENVRRDLKKRK